MKITDWHQGVPNLGHVEERAATELPARRPITIEETHSQRAEFCPELSVVRRPSSVRFDAENRPIAVGIDANLWTVERLELMAWTRAERSISCVLLPQIACFRLVCPVCHGWDFLHQDRSLFWTRWV
ncbi:hypothetical protein ACVIHC_004602 [Bradyrhizobium diazoefficiens]